MAFKYSVGQAVEYRPAQEAPGLFKVIRQMPEEDGASDRKYRIKSLKEGFERTVSEYDLQPADLTEGAYPEVLKPPKAGRSR
jgi:hypothetical protein